MSKKTDQSLIRLLRETEKIVLQDIRLVDLNSRLGVLREGSLPDQATQTINLSIQVNREGAIAVAMAGFKLAIAYGEPKDDEPCVEISAKFRIQYAFRKPIVNKHIQDAVQKVAMLNAWPYWREVVQSMLMRMGLPAFPIPLINVAQLRKEIAASSDAQP